ncbi:MAG: hypothetical protein EXS31_18295, partial [Pedosphaera sp.]|nr:hypothetical protein [Pedosphaera sp.]
MMISDGNRTGRWSAWQCLRTILLLLPLSFCIGRSLAQSNCITTLLTPALDVSVGFPRSFSWSLTGSCLNPQVAFATNGELPDVAYVFATTASPTSVSVTDWDLIKSSLDPEGTTDEFYWTLVDADETSFLELASWRRFYTRSRITAINPTPQSGTSHLVGQNFSFHLDLNYDAISSGVLQVSISSADDPSPQIKWTAVGQTGQGSKSFDFALTSSVAGVRNYTITCQLRSNVAAGPLGSVQSDDTVSTLSPFMVNWQNDTVAPSISLLSPNSNHNYATEINVLSLAGNAADDVGVAEVIWTNNRGGSGTATGTDTWSVTGIPLQVGLNEMVVTAIDSAGNETDWTLAVTYTPPDTTKPALSINSPTASSSYATAVGVLNLAGSASDNVAVAQVTWANDRGGSGTASGTSNWSISGITLLSGLNNITVTARDTIGNESATTLAVFYTPPDTTKPALSINSPTASSSYATAVGVLNLAGSASDNIAVAQVTWANDRGGSGTASGTSNWSISGITLLSGLNTLTVTARDTVGNESATTLAVTYTPPDTTKPSLSINSPTTSSSYATAVGVLNLAGNASDNVAVAQVTWANDRGGSGTASGTSNWSISGITLLSGLNTLTVTARD